MSKEHGSEKYLSYFNTERGVSNKILQEIGTEEDFINQEIGNKKIRKYQKINLYVDKYYKLRTTYYSEKELIEKEIARFEQLLRSKKIKIDERKEMQCKLKKKYGLTTRIPKRFVKRVGKQERDVMVKKRLLELQRELDKKATEYQRDIKRLDKESGFGNWEEIIKEKKDIEYLQFNARHKYREKYQLLWKRKKSEAVNDCKKMIRDFYRGQLIRGYP